MFHKRIRNITLGLVMAGLLGAAAYAACNCANFATTSLTQLGTGFLADASYSSDGCQGWTLARYSGTSEITADRIIAGRLCSNGQTDSIVNEQVFDDYILAEYYWNLSTPDVHDKGRCKVIQNASNQAQAFVDP